MSTSPKQKQSTTRCNVCNQYHATESCNILLNLLVDDRVAKMKEKKLCYNCLSKEHIKPNCKNVPTCSICNKKGHHTLVHGRTKPPQQLSVNASTFYQKNPQVQNHMQNYHYQAQNQNLGHQILVPKPPQVNSVEVTGAMADLTGLSLPNPQGGNGQEVVTPAL